MIFYYTFMSTLGICTEMSSLWLEIFPETHGIFKRRPCTLQKWCRPLWPPKDGLADWWKNHDQQKKMGDGWGMVRYVGLLKLKPWHPWWMSPKNSRFESPMLGYAESSTRVCSFCWSPKNETTQIGQKWQDVTRTLYIWKIQEQQTAQNRSKV